MILKSDGKLNSIRNFGCFNQLMRSPVIKCISERGLRIAGKGYMEKSL